MKAQKLIERHEGWRSKPYKDTTGHWTVGYGFNLETVKLPQNVGKQWLQFLIMKYSNELHNTYGWFSELDSSRQAALIDFYYNIGAGGFASFKNMIQAFENKNYNEAARQMLDSKWADQVGTRATDLAAIIRGDNHNGI